MANEVGNAIEKPLTKGEAQELGLLAQGPQPAYAGHQNRARSGVQMRLVQRKLARFLPLGDLTEMLAGRFPEHETVEITEAGRLSLATTVATPSDRGGSDGRLSK